MGVKEENREERRGGVKLNAGGLSPNTPGEERVKGQIEVLSGIMEDLSLWEVGKVFPHPQQKGFYFLGGKNDS